MSEPYLGADPSDEELLVSASPVDFGDFYDRHINSLVRYFLRRTACAQTAADLSAETFAQALSSRHRYDPQYSARAWLYTIAKRQLSRYHRRAAVETRARRRLGVDRIEVAEDQFARVEDLVWLEQSRALHEQALADLSPRVRSALKLRVIDRLSYAQLATRLGCSEGAARVRVSRGLAKLADDLEEVEQ